MKTSLQEHDTRKAFIHRLYTFSERERAHLLKIETDDELRTIKELAMILQCFEVAATCTAILRRRCAEILVNTFPNKGVESP